MYFLIDTHNNPVRLTSGLQTRILRLTYLFNVICLVSFHIVSELKAGVELGDWDLQEEETEVWQTEPASDNNTIKNM